MAFVHLHLHSEYSLLDGACRLKDIVSRAAELGQDTVAVTDHGNMFAAVDFYTLCLEKGIRPIIGCEVYVARRTRFDCVHQLDSRPYHLILLCENNEGYRNLVKLVSLGYIEGFYSKPRIDLELLKKYHGGLIALSGCIAGEVPRRISEGDYEGARETALLYRDIFGEDNYYIEVQNHRIPEDTRILPFLYKLSAETGIPLAATNDAHYVRREDAKIQRTLLAIQTNTLLSEKNPLDFPNDEFYMKSEDEMLELFPNHSDAVYNTAEIAKRCRVEFDFGNIKLPRYDLTEELRKKYPENKEYFKALCYDGLEKRYGTAPAAEITERLEYELSVIIKMGYTDYYLIVWDFVNYAKSHDIPVGPGRGSGAGSLAAYCIGITDIDPLKYNLLFERFLNPERVSMPDFDIDFCYEGRQRVIDYVISRYGEDRVSQIVTFGTLAAKGAVRDTARVMGLPYGLTDEAARLIPSELHITLDKALEQSAELKEMYSSDSKVRALIDTAKSIEGMPRNTSTHAAGVVISDIPVMNYVPLMKKDGVTAAQYTMTALERLGLLKMDFLGLRNLTIIRDACRYIQRNEPCFDINKIPENDRETFEMMSAGDTLGVFQFESGGMRSMLTRLKPVCIEDLIAAVSLYRPGPMESIPRYIENRRRPESIVYKHPLLKNILDVTYGCIVYQEQVMEICRTLAGYSYGKADVVRRAMAKKKHGVMEKERDSFVDGCVKNGVSKEIADSIFNEMAGFASYAFNKSHAAAYSYLAYRTAYLKRHYFKEYMAALMTANEGGSLNEYISECRARGAELLRPDINESGAGFTPVSGGIRFSLTAVKNVGEGIIRAVVSEREKNGNFRSAEDFSKRMRGTEINRRACESLIKCGAMDCFGYNRRQMILNFDRIFDFSAESARMNVEGQIDFFGAGNENMEIKSDVPYVEEYPDDELFALEKEVLGMYVSGHPMDKFDIFIKALRLPSLSEYSVKPENTPVTAICTVSSAREHITKKGGRMAFTVMSDKYSEIEALVFPSVFSAAAQLIKEGEIIALNGHISRGSGTEAKIIADGIISAVSFVKNIAVGNNGKLFIRCKSTDGELIGKVAEICVSFTGKSKVVFYFTDLDKKAAAKKISGVSITRELLSALNKTAGEDNIAVVLN